MKAINPARRIMFVILLVSLFFAVVSMACGGGDDNGLVCPTGPGSCYNPALGNPTAVPTATDVSTLQEVKECVDSPDLISAISECTGE